ncbi:MAG: acyl carrier protein [Pseudomonadota bacterium]
MKEELTDYFVNTLLKGNLPENFDDNFNLLQESVLDSIGIMELVQYLSEKYSINVNFDEVVPENFGNIISLSKYVEKKTLREQRPPH